MTTSEHYDGPVEPTDYVAQQNQTSDASLPTASTDFVDAQRALLALPDVPFIMSRDGKHGSVVWDFTRFEFVAEGDEGHPGSVSGPVWRQGQLDGRSGVFQVSSGAPGQIYQVRGYDLANLTIVTGDTGLVVIDPLGSYETAQAALKLYRETTGDASRPVRAVIYTQSGVDHFGGVRGLFDGDIPKDLKVYAPDGFLTDAVLRQITNGAHNARLIDYAYGTRLDASPSGLVDSDIGRTVSVGTSTFLAPTDTFGGLLPAATKQADWPAWADADWHAGLYAIEIDGVKLILQPAGGHTSPAEMNLYLPDFRAVYLPGPGLLGTPGKHRADLLSATLTAFGTNAEIGLAAYGWPVWPNEDEDSHKHVTDWLTAHRDAAFTDNGAVDTGALAPLFIAPGYLETPTRTVREVWACLTGDFLGTAQLAVSAKTTLVTHGGAAKAVQDAQAAYDAETPDYAKVVNLLDPVISAASIPLAVNSKTEQQARTLQSKALVQLGYLALQGRLRNACLTAAHDVLNPGSIITRFPQTIADLAAYANPLSS
ncbi:alkyl sulfatase dimerization domain-containing protein [Streptomyces lunalinharesii]|uniref:Alkyl sulfatase dimerization domain-containing protein n=1 Tax=Streptomyces lunalinharesii TaxID=333384 RepID=A0ABP6F3Q1_9ACTN